MKVGAFFVSRLRTSPREASVGQKKHFRLGFVLSWIAIASENKLVESADADDGCVAYHNKNMIQSLSDEESDESDELPSSDDESDDDDRRPRPSVSTRTSGRPVNGRPNPGMADGSPDDVTDASSLSFICAFKFCR